MPMGNQQKAGVKHGQKTSADWFKPVGTVLDS